MNRDQKVVLILVVGLFLVCNLVTCLGALSLGGLWGVPMPTRTPVQPRRTPISAVIVISVVEDSPAAQAGIRPRDLILAVDGQRIEGSAHFAEIISGFRPGDRVELTVRRGGAQSDAHPGARGDSHRRVRGAGGERGQRDCGEQQDRGESEHRGRPHAMADDSPGRSAPQPT